MACCKASRIDDLSAPCFLARAPWHLLANAIFGPFQARGQYGSAGLKVSVRGVAIHVLHSSNVSAISIQGPGVFASCNRSQDCSSNARLHVLDKG